jgi:hypothetical protein
LENVVTFFFILFLSPLLNKTYVSKIISDSKKKHNITSNTELANN